MSNLISQKKFADICGVTPPAVSKAIRNQRLNKVGTKIDLDCDLSKAFLKLQQESEPTPQKKTSKKKTEKKKTPVDSDDKPIQLSLDLMSDQQLMLYPKVDIDQLEKIQTARTKNFNHEVSRNNYIHRNLIRQLFAKLYTIDKDEFKAFEERLTPTICGIFGFQPESDEAIKLMELLNAETTRVLEHRQRKIADFVKATKEKKK